MYYGARPCPFNGIWDYYDYKPLKFPHAWRRKLVVP